MFGNLDPEKLLVILVLALVLLGPERLPKVFRQLGAAWRELTRVRAQVTEEVRSAIPDLNLPELPNIPRYKAGAITGFLSDLTRPSAGQGARTTPASGGGTSAAGDGAGSGGVEPGAFGALAAGPASAPVGEELATGAAGNASVRTVAAPALSMFDDVPGLDDPGMN